MKKLFSLVFILFLATSAFAQPCFKSGNNTVCGNTDGSIEFQMDTSGKALFSAEGTPIFSLNDGASGNLFFGGTAPYFGMLTAGNQITFGGGTINSSTSGSRVIMESKTFSGTGDLTLSTADGANADIFLDLNASGSDVVVRNSSSAPLWTFSHAGALTGDSTSGGDLVLSKSGAALSVQEATATSACMGVATPNGTTPVAVTTSCATSGSRVFYTRVGAVANMASISTTTAPSGSGFSFASTGASDTLASSVVYLIVKESA